MKKNIKKASALRYKQGENAPIVVAKGKGIIAENIINIAKNEKIPVYRDEKLSNQLQNLEIGEEIPAQLYEVVAEILAFIAKIDKEYD